MTRQPAIFLLLLLLFTSSTTAQFSSAPTTNTAEDCSIHNGCLECVSSGCGWGIGTCFSSCDELPELSCYSLNWWQGGAQTPEDVCALQQAQTTDAALCGTRTTCEDCTTTSLTATSRQQDSSTLSTCSWYEDRKTCSNLVCDTIGCSSPYCPSTPSGACYFGADNCRDCLELEDCKWSGGRCELFCAADTTCYSSTVNEFSDLSTNEICTASDNSEADTALCTSQLDCEACTNAVQSDGTSTCEWYVDTFAFGTGWCGVGGCDLNGNCGLDSCEAVPEDFNTIEFNSCPGLAALDVEDLTCQACLEADCGWTLVGGGQCLSTCSLIADAPCYDQDESETVQATCATAEADLEDVALCGAVTNEGCEVCTSTLKSDRRSTCQWYQDEFSGTSYCGVGGCDQLGNCGATVCTDDSSSSGGSTGECSPYLTCQACLINTPCVWDGNECFGSCNDVTGGRICYSGNEPEFALQSNFAICRQADTASGSGNQDGVVTAAPDSGATAWTSVVGLVTMVVVAMAVSF